jgi:transcriptional regulator with XRE-family HTH domain
MRDRIKPLDLKILLMRKGISQTQIASDLGVTRQAVNFIIEGKGRSGRIELAIAVSLGQDVNSLFPGKNS